MVRRSEWYGATVCCLLGVCGCKPELEGRASYVTRERVLAVRSVPADAKPQAKVNYQALYVGPQGTVSGDDLDWALCHQRKALIESGAVTSGCLVAQGDGLQALGLGNNVDAMLPKDACELFGPTPPTPKSGEPSARPVDPDTTGGYYQSVRTLADSDQYAIGVTRLDCGLRSATHDQSVAYTKRYRANENPTLEQLTLVRADGSEDVLPSAAQEEVATVAAGETISLRASWASCNTDPVCGDGVCGPDEDSGNGPSGCAEDCQKPRGCTGSEPYVYFDPRDRTLRDRRESLRISWFATEGRFDHERTGRGESEADATETSNSWQAPNESGEVWLWVVIRDDRGGVGFGSYRLRVE